MPRKRDENETAFDAGFGWRALRVVGLKVKEVSCAMAAGIAKHVWTIQELIYEQYTMTPLPNRARNIIFATLSMVSVGKRLEYGQVCAQ